MQPQILDYQPVNDNYLQVSVAAPPDAPLNCNPNSVSILHIVPCDISAVLICTQPTPNFHCFCKAPSQAFCLCHRSSASAPLAGSKYMLCHVCQRGITLFHWVLESHLKLVAAESLVLTALQISMKWGGRIYNGVINALPDQPTATGRPAVRSKASGYADAAAGNT